MLIRMKDLSDGNLKLYSGMTDGQLKRGEVLGRDLGGGVFIAESRRVLERALDAGARPLSLFVEERWLAHERPVIDRLEALDPRFPVYVATNGQFRSAVLPTCGVRCRPCLINIILCKVYFIF